MHEGNSHLAVWYLVMHMNGSSSVWLGIQVFPVPSPESKPVVHFFHFSGILSLLKKAPTCGGYLCVVFNFPPEWGPWSWLSFCFPDWLPTPFFTEPAQNKAHTPQTLTTGWLCAFSVFLLLPLPSLAAFRSQRKVCAPFYGWPLHLCFGSFSPPASFWPALHQWSASSALRPFGVFVYSFSTRTLNACCCPVELCSM